MPFKLNTDGTIATTGEGDKKQPIFVSNDGRESPFDVDSTVSTIARLNSEARGHREAKEAAEAFAKPFKDAGIEDPIAAKSALDTVKNLSTGDLKTAAQVQEIRDAATKTANEAVANATRAAAEKERALSEQNTKLTSDLNNHIIGGAFAGSKFISEKLAIPADIAQKVFGDRFKVENGKLVPLDANGQPIFSMVNHGSHASFEEAFPVIVNAYPNKDMILKGSGASGGGATNTGGNNAGKKTYTRSQFAALSPQEQSSVGLEASQNKAVITD